MLADDLIYGDVRCLNPKGKIATPQMDRLAASGMIFTDAHASSSVCTPSRYSILTGRYNWRSRLQSGVFGGFSAPLIDRERMTVPAFLKQDNVSFLPALAGASGQPVRETIVHNFIHGRFALRQAIGKLELCPGRGGWGKPTDAAAKEQGLPRVQL